MEFIPNNINHIWSAMIMEELHRQGVKTVCIAPGSRSTPLTWAAAEHPDLTTVVHFDERGLAFHALGLAKAGAHPVALVCTSGSAVANMLPAVVEASMSHTPLILLTADRPFELVDCGANQTINQTGIFGEYVRWESTLPCPTTEIAPQVVLSTIDHAVSRAADQNPGPVHINCPFREPLAPDSDDTNGVAYLESVERWREGEDPWTQYIQGEISESIGLAECADLIENTSFGLLVVGQLRSMLDLETVRKLAESLGWPVVADITSGARLGHYVPHVVAYADQMLQGTWRDSFTHLETIIHIGGSLVSKRLQTLFETHPPNHYIRIAFTPERLDPSHQVTHRIEYHSNIYHTISSLDSIRADASWRDDLIEKSKGLDTFFAEKFSDETVTEPGVMRFVTERAGKLGPLFLGNSMPIRDADMYGASASSATWVYANRGASGIDGNIATAAGVAGEGATAVLGDLATLHDLNSLALLRTNKVVLVVINNGGGGIFSFLPVSEHGELVEEFFGTPHECDFQFAANMFDINYTHPSTMTDFRQEYETALDAASSTIIEVTTDRDENLAFHRTLEQNVINYMKS